MANVKLSVPDDILKQVNDAATRVSPGKKFRLEFTLDAISKEIHVAAVYKKERYAVGAFVTRTAGGVVTAGAGGSIEFEPSP